MPELKPDKGKRGGSCNRTACQAPGAIWWNRGSRAWYCEGCAILINEFGGMSHAYQDEHGVWAAGDPMVVLP